MSTLGVIDYDGAIHFCKETDEKKETGILTVSKDNLERMAFPQWAPTWDIKHDHTFKNIETFKHIDRGLFADPELKSLKNIEGIQFKRVSPKLGLEVDGVQLSSLSNQQKDDLALLVAKHGVIAFRNQDLKNQSFESIKDWGRYYGPLHVHPTSGAPDGHPEFHLVYRRGSADEQVKMFQNKLHNIIWHTDVAYENQPPGLTLFAMLESGDAGGDTQFLDLFEAYDRLSPLMKDLIDDLKVLNTSQDQARSAKLAGGIERKDPSDNIHPLVRYHPVLKRKGLYVNRNFSRRILGMKIEESDNLLLFLINHIEKCLDAHVRMNWDEDTVVVWDNRRVLHTATFDWDTDDIRHAFRVTTIAERPVASEEEYESWTPELEIEEQKSIPLYINMSPVEYYEKVIKP
jgi:sulfonate dioxygenase